MIRRPQEITTLIDVRTLTLFLTFPIIRRKKKLWRSGEKPELGNNKISSSIFTQRQKSSPFDIQVVFKTADE
jgi:hypothetical protein